MRKLGEGGEFSKIIVGGSAEGLGFNFGFSERGIWRGRLFITPPRWNSRKNIDAGMGELGKIFKRMK